MKTVYLFDENGVYTREYEAQENPFYPGHFIVPTYSLDIAPEIIPGFRPVVVDGAWVNTEDHRGVVFDTVTGDSIEHHDLGALPSGLTKVPKPNGHYHWVSGEWVLDVQSAKLAKSAEINAERARRWRAGFPVTIAGQVKWFHSDEFSLTQHLGLKDKARDLIAVGGVMADVITIGGEPISWSTMSGALVEITAQIAFDLVAAAGVQQALIFEASRVHLVALNATENPDTYDVSVNWPVVFWE